MSLRDVVLNYPAIDNHAHPLLKEEHRQALPIEGAISEAQPDAIKDAVHSLPGYRATRQLAELYGLDPSADWEEIKSYRDSLEYDQLCNTNMEKLGIQCLLLDDGLPGVQEMAHDLSWHERFTSSSVYRLVRIEPVAEVRVRSPRRYWHGVDSASKGHSEITLSDRSRRVWRFLLRALRNAAGSCTQSGCCGIQVCDLLPNWPQRQCQPRRLFRC